MKELIEKLKNLQAYTLQSSVFNKGCWVREEYDPEEENYVLLSDLQKVIAEMEGQLTTK